MAVRQFTFLLVPAVSALFFAGCSGNQNPLTQAGALEEKPADSVYRESSPQPRSNNLEAKLNSYRQDTYQSFITAGGTVGRVPHNDAVYTEAYRHAVYLNGINSAAWTRTLPSAADTQEITADSEYADLLLEGTVAPLDGQFPALFTSPSLFTRLEAVRGGRNVIAAANCRTSTAFETYVFDGNIERTDGKVSFFRGFENSRATFDAVDNVWYQRRGRMLLARPGLRYFGYGQKCDDSRISCDVPYPIMDGQFLGVLTSLSSYPEGHQLGWWPNDGNNNVNPYGLDTDISGLDQYAGPPIHITLPINQPIPKATGIRTLTFGRDDNAVPTVYPTSLVAYRQYKVFCNVEGLVVPSIVAPVGGQFRAAGPNASILSNLTVTGVTAGLYTTPAPVAQSYTFAVDPATDLSQVVPGDKVILQILSGNFAASYRYDITAVDDGNKTVTFFIPAQFFTTLAPYNAAFPPGVYSGDLTQLKLNIEPRATTSVAGILDENLHDGEIVIVPVGPLQNLTTYKVTFQIITPSYDSGLQTFRFTTNANGIYDPN